MPDPATATPDRRTLCVGAAAAVAVAAAVGACSPTVKVEAPDKPIEINLNVRIDQEVRIKVDRELEEAIQENPDIF